MDEVLETMGEFFSSQSEVKKQATNALIYPLFIFIVAIGMSAFLITFVVPQMAQIFEDTGQELPAITTFVLNVSDFFTKYWIHTLVGLIILLIILQFSYSRIFSFRKLIDKAILKLPSIGDIVQNYELGRFSYILSLMLDSGVSYAQAVQLASTTKNS